MKKLIIFAVCLILVTLCTGCSGNNLGTDNIDYDEFVKTVTDSHADIMEASIILSSIAGYENSSWKALESVGGRIQHQSMVESALDWLSDQTDIGKEEIEDSYNSICAEYKEIIAMGTEGPLAEEIMSEYKNLFTGYDSLYRLVLSPSGSRSDFIDSYNEQVQTIQSADSLLSTLTSEL